MFGRAIFVVETPGRGASQFATEGRLRQHYQNITTYARRVSCLAFVSEQGDLEKPETITHYEN